MRGFKLTYEFERFLKREYNTGVENFSNVNDVKFDKSKIQVIEDKDLISKSIYAKSTEEYDPLVKIIYLIEHMPENATVAFAIHSGALLDTKQKFIHFRKYIFDCKCLEKIVQFDIDNVHRRDDYKCCFLIFKKFVSNTHFLFLERCTHLSRHPNLKYYLSPSIKEAPDLMSDYKEKYNGKSMLDIIVNDDYKLLPSYLFAKLFVEINSYKTISQFATLVQGCHSRYIEQARRVDDKDDGDFVFEPLRVQYISRGMIDINIDKFSSTNENIEKFLLKKGDIIMVIKTFPYKSVLITDEDAARNLIPTSSFIIIRPNENVSPAFLYHAINNIGFKEYIKDISLYKMFPSLNNKDIASSPVLIEDDSSKECITNEYIKRAIEIRNKAYKDFIEYDKELEKLWYRDNRYALDDFFKTEYVPPLLKKMK